MHKLPFVAIAVLFPTAAFAHTGVHEAAGLFLGLAHPLDGLDHLLTMVAVGAFAFTLGGRALWLVPLSFVIMMIVGFLLGFGAVGVPLVELGIAASSVVIAGAAAIRRPISLAAAMSLVGVFAVFHGHAHGTELPGGTECMLYAIGFAITTASLHLAGIVGAFGVARLVGKPYARADCRAGPLGPVDRI
jgi:urease accessory protein